VKVTALLVSHNGSRWLPAVIGGVRESRRRPDRIVAVDTGSSDDSVPQIEQGLGVEVLHLDPRTPYAESVRVGLATLPPAEPDEWVWLLHDDSNPAPDCLAVLVEEAENAPQTVAVLGPKHREWPSLKRLLEVGVTLTGTGQRETGLERGEYDQGQHDDPHQVLAVNTAGMLVRRDVLESVGFDQHLPVFGTDIDFGWRVARAGYVTRVVPDAIVFHVEASRRGRRTSDLVDHPGRQERVGAQYTLLVNSPAWTIPFRSARMMLGGLLRALGLLLVRAPGEATDEVAALLEVFTHPARVLKARRARAGSARVPHQSVRPLLAPFWLPYRHGLDYVTDIGVAVANSIQDQLERRRPPGTTTATPLRSRLSRLPALWVLGAALLLAFVAGRHFLGSGPLHGGALLPVPDGVAHWWSVWGGWHHTLGTGSHAPGPAYLFPLALLATILFGHPGLVVVLIFLFAVPVSFVGAHRFLRRVTQGNWAPVWGAATYALLPAISGAFAQGRLGTVVGAAVLPWVGVAALGLGEGSTGLRADVGEDAPPVEVRRWRAAWRTALAAGILTAFVPPAYLVILLVLTFGAATGVLRGRRREVLVIVLLPLFLVLPWAIATLGSPGAWLVEAGRAAAIPLDPSVLDLFLGRIGGPGAAPIWVAAGLPLAGIVAFLRPDTRRTVLGVWVVILATSVVLAAASRVPVSLPGVPVDFRPWPGFLVLTVQAGFVVAAAVAADGIVSWVSRASFSWRQPVAAVAAVAAIATPVVGVGWWVAHGSDGPVNRSVSDQVPIYMQELAQGNDLSAVLRLTGGVRNGISYQVLRSGPQRLGDDGALAMTAPDPRFRSLLERLLADARPTDAATLASYGVKYVYAPAPVSDAVSGGVDAAAGFGGASGPDPGSRAWVVESSPTLASVSTAHDLLRPLWVALDVIAFLTALVLAAPERKRR
jgi:GT2 family glycosyltransferase